MRCFVARFRIEGCVATHTQTQRSRWDQKIDSKLTIQTFVDNFVRQINLRAWRILRTAIMIALPSSLAAGLASAIARWHAESDLPEHANAKNARVSIESYP